MRIGQLRHSITIEQVTEVRDGRGETTPTWATLKTLRAGIFPQSGTENFKAHQDNSKITHKIVIRYQPGITTKMRVNFGGRILDIDSVINVAERSKIIHLMAVENL